jgi:hypothetical protein
MQDRPTAQELLKAAREFCERELGPSLEGRMRFQVRVLQNILGILEREWTNEEQAVRDEWERLGQLLGTHDAPASFTDLIARVKNANSELAAKIRSGDMDDRWDEVLDAVRKTVADKLEIANPNYSAPASSDT